ncbi:MAG: hypothetical protein MZU84_06535 [Sphingobacterium sp.]|nr:hypothetical protein [Sphingobacterium sp.]
MNGSIFRSGTDKDIYQERKNAWEVPGAGHLSGGRSRPGEYRLFLHP